MRVILCLFHQHFLLWLLPSSPLSAEVCAGAVCPVILPPDAAAAAAASGLLLLREVEDLAVGLPQVLLLFEVHLKRSLDGDEGDTSL